MDRQSSITREEFYALAGLLALAHEHEAALRSIERAACRITGEEYDSAGHTWDAMYNGYSVTQLLDKLQLGVTDE